MTESGPPTRNKRLAARFFKNPPQPHMCIQDYLQGSVQPCYVNVLSWDKITTANCPFDQLRLYGGMKITPPRTEKPMTTVFFVIANPEILRTNGKTASDPKEQGMLIELLLDFIEAMNKGVIFKRQYKILPDIFIIGELKLIWELVQNDRAKMQNELQQQSQLDDSNRKPVPQYPHYQNYQSHQDFQQKQQQQQQQQQQQHHHLQQVQQQQHQQNNNESLVKPPQYQASNSHWQQHYQDNHANQEFNPSYYHSLLSIASNNNHRDDWLSKDQIPSSSSSAIPGGGVVVAGGSGLVVDKNQQPILQQQQPNPCMYQYQQLSGQIYSYNVSKVHAKQNPNPPMSLPVVNNCGQVQYMSYNHFHPENNVYVKVHRMQQPQQPQIQLAHAPPQVNSMSIENFYKDQSKMIAPNYHHNLQQQHQHQQQQQQQQQRSQLPEMSCNGSIGSLPSSSSSSSSSSQSNSPIRLLQRNASLENPTLYNNTKKIQVTDLDEDEPKDNPSTSCNKIDTNHTNAATTTTTSSIDTGYYEIIKLPQSENSNNQIDNQQVNNDINNQGKMRILKRSKSLSDDKNGNRDIKIMKNCGDKSSDDDDNKEKLNYDTEQDDDDNKCHEFVNQTEINKNGCAIKNNNTIDNFDNKQLIGTSCDVANCIVDNKSLINKPDNNNDDNDDKLTNAIAQMSIKDCTTNDAGEFHGVIS